MASLNTGTSAVTSLRNTWMYCMQKAGVSGTLGGGPAPWGEPSQKALGAEDGGAQCGWEAVTVGGSLLSRNLSDLVDV